jgi:predicted nucleic acid-binding protein
MTALLDTSVLIASMDEDEPAHERSHRLLAAGGALVYMHALAETFSVLTGGRRERRVEPALAARLIDEAVLPFVKVVSLTPRDMITALGQCQARGVRGGAIYDFLHLCAARKAAATDLFTLDVRHFEAIARAGDPRVRAP